jgi:hypothetical protein
MAPTDVAHNEKPAEKPAQNVSRSVSNQLLVWINFAAALH